MPLAPQNSLSTSSTSSNIKLSMMLHHYSFLCCQSICLLLEISSVTAREENYIIIIRETPRGNWGGFTHAHNDEIIDIIAINSCAACTECALQFK